jgi:hypothetical protein
MALIPLYAGLGILRKRVWSAYGYAVYTLAQLALLPPILFRSRHSAGTTLAEIGGSAALSLLIGVLFLLAGRSLAETGGVRGMAWPWIAVSAVCVVEPFVVPTGAMENTIPDRRSHRFSDRDIVQPRTR